MVKKLLSSLLDHQNMLARKIIEVNRGMLTASIMLMCFACQQTPERKTHAVPKAEPVTHDTGKLHQPVIAKKLYTSATDDPYATDIPPDVRRLLKDRLPIWKLPSKDSWEKYWFDLYQKKGALVNYLSGDFNGDQKPDYAFILENKRKQFAVWVLQSDGQVYNAFQLTELTEAALPLNIGIERLEKGKLDYLSIKQGTDSPQSLYLEHQAIQVIYFEAAATTYYWKDGYYHEVTTGD